MELPIAVQTDLEMSEGEFQGVLERLGLNRETLSKVSDRMKNATNSNPPRKTIAVQPRGRVYHV